MDEDTWSFKSDNSNTIVKKTGAGFFFWGFVGLIMMINEVWGGR